MKNLVVTKYTGNPENYTPAVYIEAVRRVLGESATVDTGTVSTAKQRSLNERWYGIL
jgi:hypothetical protein